MRASRDVWISRTEDQKSLKSILNILNSIAYLDNDACNIKMWLFGNSDDGLEIEV